MPVSLTPKYVSYTTYPNGRVGMTIQPTPSLSLTELQYLIRELQFIEREMTIESVPEGVTIIGLDDPKLVHDTIADAIGEPKS